MFFMKLINCKKSISLILAMLLTSMYAAYLRLYVRR